MGARDFVGLIRYSAPPMKDETLFAPSFAMAHVKLDAGEKITVESGSMVAMTTGMEMKTKAGGNIFFALLRKLLGGESLFVNQFYGPGEVYVAPAMSGDILRRRVEAGQTLYVQGTSYLAHTGDLEVRARWGGFRMLFGGEGAFLLEVKGQGEVWLNCYGAMREASIGPEGLVVDTGHVVAFDEAVTYKLEAAGGGLFTSWKSGEGFVFRFSGSGKVLLQSRTEGSLVGWITKFIMPG